MYQYGLPLTVVVLGICFFLCVTNAIFSSIKARNRSTWDKQSIFTSTKAWITYAFCISVMIIGVFVFSASKVMAGFSNIGKAQDTITQQQEQNTATDDGTDSTSSSSQTQ